MLDRLPGRVAFPGHHAKLQGEVERVFGQVGAGHQQARFVGNSKFGMRCFAASPVFAAAL